MQKLLENINEIYINIEYKDNLYLLTEDNFKDNKKLIKKYNNAIDSYINSEIIEEGEIALFLFDDTAFGSAKDGFLISTKSIYFKELFEDGTYIDFKNATPAIIEDKDILINNISISMTLLDTINPVLDILNYLIKFNNIEED